MLFSMKQFVCLAVLYSVSIGCSAGSIYQSGKTEFFAAFFYLFRPIVPFAGVPRTLRLKGGARNSFIAGNWKLNPTTLDEAKALASAVFVCCFYLIEIVLIYFVNRSSSLLPASLRIWISAFVAPIHFLHLLPKL
jgi:hypothetical protein